MRLIAIILLSLLLTIGCTTPTSSTSNTTKTDTTDSANTTGKKDSNSGNEDTTVSRPDLNSGKTCGNGKIDLGEKCDIAVASGTNACPTSCSAPNKCSTVQLSEDGCQTECVITEITDPKNGDGCCPTGATSSNDTDCPKLELCGNGKVDDGETCDTEITEGEGACPLICDDNNACTDDIPSGTNCTAECFHLKVTDKFDGDQCCPEGADFSTDSDCPKPQLCGNGTLDDGESCDTAITSGAPRSCPTTCPDESPCRKGEITGSGCLTKCEITEITERKNGDGCCPNGENHTTDNDCEEVELCGNKTVDTGETCDISLQSGNYGYCYKFHDFSSCTVKTRNGEKCGITYSSSLIPTYDESLEIDSGFDGCCLFADPVSAGSDGDWACAYVPTFFGQGGEIPKNGELTRTFDSDESIPIRNVKNVWVDLTYPDGRNLKITLKPSQGDEVVLKDFGSHAGYFGPTLFTINTPRNIYNAIKVSAMLTKWGNSKLPQKGKLTWTLTVIDNGAGGGVLKSWRIDFVSNDQDGIFYSEDVPAQIPSNFPNDSRVSSSITIPKSANVSPDWAMEIFVNIDMRWQGDLRLELQFTPEGGTAHAPITLKEIGGDLGPTDHRHIFAPKENFKAKWHRMRPLTYRFDSVNCSLLNTDNCSKSGAHSVLLSTKLPAEKSGTWTLTVINKAGFSKGTLINWRIAFW